MFRWFLNLFQEDRTFGSIRSSQWPKVRAEHLKKFPRCAVCDKKGTLLNSLEAHHIKVFNKFPELELDPTNIITLCRQDHLSWGHLYLFSSWNERVKEDAREWRSRVKNRP